MHAVVLFDFVGIVSERFVTCFAGLSSQTCEAPKVTSKTTTKIYLSLKCPSGNAAACHIKEYWIYFWRLHFVPESGTRKTSANTFAFVHLHPHTLYQFRVNATYNGQNCAKKPLALGPAVRVRTQAVGKKLHGIAHCAFS